MEAGKPDSVEEIQPRIFDLPELDILVSNAGISGEDSVEGLVNEVRNSVLELNLKAPVKLIRAATKVMKNARKGGQILNVSSIFGSSGGLTVTLTPHLSQPCPGSIARLGWNWPGKESCSMRSPLDLY